MHSKAQVSIDFTISIMIAMILFVIILYSAHSHHHEMDSVVQSMDAKHVSERLAWGIDEVYLAGNGAAGRVNLPETVHGGKNYALRVYPGSVLINYSSREGEKFCSHRILTKNINGTGSGLELTPGTIQITNTNGTIYLENV